MYRSGKEPNRSKCQAMLVVSLLFSSEVIGNEDTLESLIQEYFKEDWVKKRKKETQRFFIMVLPR